MPDRTLCLLVTCALVALFAAGCVERERDDRDDGTAAGGAAFSGFVYPCTASMSRTGDTCVGFVGDGRRMYGEPTVAVHPTDDRIAAIASIVAPAAPASAPLGGALLDVFDIDVHVTEDGGATWSTSRVPLERVLANHPEGDKRVGQNTDPAMAFDASGVLHFSGLVIPILGGNFPDVYYTSSADMGRTWSDPLFLTTDGKADRPWLSVSSDGVVYVSWAHGPESATAAWSEDGGATWTALTEEGVPCFWFLTAPVEYGVNEVSACTMRGEEGSVARVYALDRPNRNASLLAELQGPLGRPFLAPLGDELVLVVDAPAETLVYRLGNGTLDRAEPVEARAHLAGAGGWTWTRNRWATTDPWGHLHLLFEGGSGCVSGCDGAAGDVLHLILDANLTKVDERLLGPDGVRTSGSGIQQPPPDDYHGMAFGRDVGYLAWTWDGRIAWSKVARATVEAQAP